MNAPVVVVHGGAGRVEDERLDAHVAGCGVAAEAGLRALQETGDPVAAAQAAVEIMESDPQYNAGTGGCLTRDGTLELDAALMRGADLAAAALASMPPFEHPIAIARALLERADPDDPSKAPVMLCAEGAAAFARAAGFAPSADMITERAKERLAKWRAGQVGAGWAGGTVGAVAYVDGRVAAATSTGGTVGKWPGRIGDSPILGAGTWADDRSAACSATGIGEGILRHGLARVACERAAQSEDANAAGQAVLEDFAARVRGSGGFIVVTADGRVGLARNTRTMSHAIARAGEPVRTGS